MGQAPQRQRRRLHLHRGVPGAAAARRRCTQGRAARAHGCGTSVLAVADQLMAGVGRRTRSCSPAWCTCSLAGQPVPTCALAGQPAPSPRACRAQTGTPRHRPAPCNEV
eukprot:360117-Chlamydomonas_euryale.AAC.8